MRNAWHECYNAFMTIYSWLISAAWIAFIGYWIASAISAKRSVKKRSWSNFAVRAFFIIVVIVILESKAFSHFDAKYSTTTQDPIVGSIGVLLCAVGVAFAIWARIHIGRNWGMPMAVQQGAELATTGPYAYVRNPIYSGAMIAFIGTALVIGLWWLIPSALMSVYFIYSAKQEERLMMQQFPNRYPEYKKRTKMIIPFVL